MACVMMNFNYWLKTYKPQHKGPMRSCLCVDDLHLNFGFETWNDNVCDLQLPTRWDKPRLNPTVNIVHWVGNTHKVIWLPICVVNCGDVVEGLLNMLRVRCQCELIHCTSTWNSSKNKYATCWEPIHPNSLRWTNFENFDTISKSNRLKKR
jgi:hypothetical protein